MKHFIALLGVILIVLSFASCGKNDNYPYSCDGQVVTKGIYSYYLDAVKKSPEKYGADKDDTASIKEAVKVCCSEYLGTIKLMEKEGIVLDSEFKRLAAENTENIWSLFSEHFESIGVTKQDITKIQTHESRLLQLLDHYFGADGEKPVSDDDMKEEFVDMYVGFKAIEGSLTKTNDNGETVELTEKEAEELESLFRSMASKINNRTATIDELNEEYNESLGIIVTAPLSTLLMKDGDPMYDDDFFSKVSEISHGYAKMIKSGSSIYVIERQTIATDDEDAFMMYRSEVLQSMKMETVEKKITKLIKKMNIAEDEKVIEKLFS